jgi:hypothetical protein
MFFKRLFSEKVTGDFIPKSQNQSCIAQIKQFCLTSARLIWRLAVNTLEKRMDNQDSTKRLYHGVITCECGFQIPVIPDVKAVGSAIDSHIEEHKKLHTDSKLGEIAAKHIHDHLFKKLFEKISSWP